MVVSKTAHYLLLGFFYLLSFSSYAQDVQCVRSLAINLIDGGILEYGEG